MPAAEARIPYNDRGLLYGDGLFETILLTGGRMPLLPLHLERLQASAAALSIRFHEGKIREGIEAVAGSAGPVGEFAIRVTLTRGVAERRAYEPPPNARPTLMVIAAPYRRPGGPLSAITSSVRLDPASPLVRHKTISSLERVMAKGEAVQAGCDEAIMLNLYGRVAEGAGTSLFVIKQGLWMTPPLSDGCLPGVMRRRVMELTHATEWTIMPEDLRRCDAVFLTNALMGCLPLAALDGRGLPWAKQPDFSDQLFQPVVTR